ncbi:hypothetical protein ACFQ6N_37425, partial [Kitasatospora sp. NPDC056446]
QRADDSTAGQPERQSAEGSGPPSGATYILTVSRLLLGALAGWLLHSEITGLYAAVAAGASAPALLRQVGSLRTVQEVVQGVSPDTGERNPDVPVTVPSSVSEHPPMPVQPQAETTGEVSS